MEHPRRFTSQSPDLRIFYCTLEIGTLGHYLKPTKDAVSHVSLSQEAKQARISWKDLPEHTSLALRTWQDQIQCVTKTKTNKILLSSRTPCQILFLCSTMYIHICTLYLSALPGFSVLLNYIPGINLGLMHKQQLLIFLLFSHYFMHSIIIARFIIRLVFVCA